MATTTTLTIRIPTDLKETLEAEAKADDRTVTSYVVKAIRERIDAARSALISRNALRPVMTKVKEKGGELQVDDFATHSSRTPPPTPSKSRKRK